MRSIPACAGEPVRDAQGPGQDAVYPRVCGGALAPRRHPITMEGLSPRVRGSPPGRGVGKGRLGSIPACAGEP